MSGALRIPFLHSLLPLLVPLLGLFGCSATKPPAPQPAPGFAIPSVTAPPKPAPTPAAAQAAAPSSSPVITFGATPPLPPVMLGIDVLEADGFAAVKGKRLGLLTHPAGVNRRGVTTVDVLRRAPGVKLVALFAVEHGINGEFSAGKNYNDYLDKRTGLPVRSLYDGKTRKPTKAQLKDLDALVVDLQDIGTRSYTFTSAMKNAMAACFENNLEIIVLDRPNPLGGLKADGPPMDADLMSYVGAYRVPYVHGLTMGELARMTKDAPEPTGRFSLTDAQRAKGKLTVIPMRGWTRAMRWTETGLAWIPTSPLVADFETVKGYPMTGLGCELGGFKHGVGSHYAFRGILHLTTKIDVYEKELRALRLPGIDFRRISSPNTKTGKAGTGLFIEIRDYDAWRPTELNFHLMRLACKLEPKNPFASATTPQRSLFLNLMGSRAFFNDLVLKGKNTDIETWLAQWRAQAKIYQQQSQKYWLYK